MTMKLNMFNLQKQPIYFDDMEASILIWVRDFWVEEIDFHHKEELMSCVFESLCMEYKHE